MTASDLNGLLLIDKPKGLTSHDVVAKIRHVLQMQRIGHTGTLDPDATGLLILCLGKATKLSSQLTEGDKTYVVQFLLGTETDTYDASGELVAKRPVAVDFEQLRSTLSTFEGEQKQKPPLFSAVKVKGKKLYEYARKGKSVEIPERTVFVRSLKLNSYELPKGEIEVVCSKGTYVRSLIHDLGHKLGTGAVTTDIRRMASGLANIFQAVRLDQILDSPDPVFAVKSMLVASELLLPPLLPPRVLAEPGTV